MLTSIGKLSSPCTRAGRRAFSAAPIEIQNLWDGPMPFESSLAVNHKDPKPRHRGITMVREPGVGVRQFADLMEVHGGYIDSCKYPWGGMRFQPKALVEQKIKIAKEFGITYSTGGILEKVLLGGHENTMRFLEEAAQMGFDEIEISAGHTIISLEDRINIMKVVREFGMKPVPEVSMAYGVAQSVKDGHVNSDKLVWEIKELVANGAERIVIEEEGLTESVKEWNFPVIFKIAQSVPLNKLLFESDSRHAYSWYIKQFGPHLNFHVDLKDVLHLECTRRGTWGKEIVFARVATFEKP